MKKVLVLLAIVALAFTSCKKQDDLNVKEKIIGKWIFTDTDGQPVISNVKAVFTFESATKANISASLDPPGSESGSHWMDLLDADVVISGNKMTLTMHKDEHTKTVEEFIVHAIDANEFTANRKVTIFIDDNEVFTLAAEARFVKVTADYTAAILGLWECQELTGIETYNDANARLEFFDDGNYNYWRKNEDGEWEAVTDREFQNYFVDGTLLATRWKNIGEEELREWWEIASIANGEMQWTALRQNEDGTTVQQGMKWTKIN